MPIIHEIIDPNLTIRLDNGCTSGIDHWHRRAELVYVLEGQCQIRNGSLRRLCHAGELAVIRSGEIHSLWCDPGHVIYIATFDPSMYYQFFSAPSFPKPFISARELAAAGLDREIPRLLGEIFCENRDRAPLHDALMRAAMLRLYSLLIRHFEDETLRDEKSLAQLQQFQTAVEFITAHYAERITLADVAGVINYNPSYVSTLFVTCAGVNFKAYLDQFRIKRAVDLLTTTRRTVADIATQCGYDNVRTFNNAFRRVVGRSPSQMRKVNG